MSTPVVTPTLSVGGTVPPLTYKAVIKVPPSITGANPLPTDAQVKAAIKAGLTSAGISFTSVKVK